ncbi:MAG: hypothetical protein VW349_09890, partial [Gammaproteobacteria bacterium]
APQNQRLFTIDITECSKQAYLASPVEPRNRKRLDHLPEAVTITAKRLRVICPTAPPASRPTSNFSVILDEPNP